MRNEEMNEERFSKLEMSKPGNTMKNLEQCQEWPSQYLFSWRPGASFSEVSSTSLSKALHDALEFETQKDGLEGMLIELVVHRWDEGPHHDEAGDIIGYVQWRQPEGFFELASPCKKKRNEEIVKRLKELVADLNEGKELSLDAPADKDMIAFYDQPR